MGRIARFALPTPYTRQPSPLGGGDGEIRLGMLVWARAGRPHWVKTLDGEIIFDESEDVAGPADNGADCPVCRLPNCGGYRRRCISISTEKDAWLRAIGKYPNNPRWVAGCQRIANELARELYNRL